MPQLPVAIDVAYHPAEDETFSVGAARVLLEMREATTPEALERELRKAFPDACVLVAPERRANAKHAAVWHVYRDCAPVQFDPRPLALVVDDEPLNRQLVTRFLTAAGWRVVSAESAEAAVGRARSLSIDFLVTDYRMPGRSGIELARELTAAIPGLPVVVVSGSPEAALQAAEGGFGFIAKPYEIGRFLELVRQLSHRHGGVERRTRSARRAGSTTSVDAATAMNATPTTASRARATPTLGTARIAPRAGTASPEAISASARRRIGRQGRRPDLPAHDRPQASH